MLKNKVGSKMEAKVEQTNKYDGLYARYLVDACMPDALIDFYDNKESLQFLKSLLLDYAVTASLDKVYELWLEKVQWAAPDFVDNLIKLNTLESGTPKVIVTNREDHTEKFYMCEATDGKVVTTEPVSAFDIVYKGVATTSARCAQQVPPEYVCVKWAIECKSQFLKLFRYRLTEHKDGDRLCHLFTLGSNFGHSCTPNAYYIIGDGRMIVKAMVNIPAGTEITLAYAFLPNDNIAFRREYLQNVHLFECHCSACSNTDNMQPCAHYVRHASEDKAGMFVYCVWCFNEASTRCSACKLMRYCGKKCQREHWRACHKKYCCVTNHG